MVRDHSHMTLATFVNFWHPPFSHCHAQATISVLLLAFWAPPDVVCVYACQPLPNTSSHHIGICKLSKIVHFTHLSRFAKIFKLWFPVLYHIRPHVAIDCSRDSWSMTNKQKCGNESLFPAAISVPFLLMVLRHAHCCITTSQMG